MKKALSLILALSLLFLSATALSSCNTGGKVKDPTPRTKEISYVYFNTFSIITSYAGVSEKTLDSYAQVADEVLGSYHKLFDIYYEHSGVNNIKTINDNAGVNAVEVDEKLIDFLEYCKQLYTLTNGKTNIMLGSVLRIWHDVRTEASDNGGSVDKSRLPARETLDKANEHTSIESLVIDREAGTVYISDPEASIDVGAVGKGYAAQMLARELRQMGADSLAINAGGNLVTIGVKPSGEKWTTGITNPNPLSSQSFIARIRIGEGTLVTSGDYERFFISDGVRYHHVIDPDTLMPADYFTSVSIITPDSALADALSTALFCMSYEDGKALVESIGNVEVIWVDKEYNVKHTAGVVFAR
jgi:thiamine biosynthesis lipoprotein